MTDGATQLLAVPLAEHAASKQTAGEAAGETRVDEDEGAASDILSGRYACYNLYETRDGRWLSVGALEPKFWAALCRALGREELTGEQFAGGQRQQRAIETLARLFKTRDAAEWLALFGGEDVCVAPVNSIEEALGSGHLRERGAFESVPHPTAGAVELSGVAPKLSDTPGRLSKAPPPSLGQHTREVLLWAGLSDAEVEELARDRVVKA
jgi:crotonobetainyl-CoA:carnitine CoA-transferase CaiB-like acyl-CoA transferase